MQPVHVISFGAQRAHMIAWFGPYGVKDLEAESKEKKAGDMLFCYVLPAIVSF